MDTNNTQNTNGNGRGKKKRSSKALFIKTFLICLAIFSGIAIAGVLSFLSSGIRPPEIPIVSDNRFNEPAFLSPEGHEDDRLIGSIIHNPSSSARDRKELFFTFLIVGLDQGVNTDTIIVASYDGVNRKAYLVSVPRDSLVNVSRNNKKIC